MSLHVIARFVARQETLLEVRTQLSDLVDTIREDPGCIQCQLVSDRSNERAFLFVEDWRDDKALETHLSDPEVIRAVEQVAPLLAENFLLDRYTIVR